MDALGVRLVRSILHDKDFSSMTKAGVTEDSVFDKSRKSLEWITQYLRDTGEWPTCHMVEENIGISLPDEPEPLSYIVDLVRQRTLGKKIETNLTEAANLLGERDPDAALKMLGEASLELRPLSTHSQVVSYRDTGKERFDQYQDTKEFGGLIGINTPWKSLDKAVQGWVNGTFNVITAMQNTGKTWFLVLCAADALNQGKRVLYVTLEMSNFRIARRLDAAMHKLHFGKLRDCDLSTEAEETWESRIEASSDGEGDILMADKSLVKRVSDVTALVLDYKPDIVFIDGGYRFEGAAGKSSWEATVSTVNELQISAERTDIPWVVSTQQGDSNETGSERKRGVKMKAWGVRYGKEWVINPDVVLGLYQNEDLRLIKTLEIHTLKVRDASGDSYNSHFNINWDTNEMEFSESVSPEDDAEGLSDFSTSVAF
jgi:replicative DNA helicase